MASEIKVDTIVNAGGDNDTGIDLATNDQILLKVANATKLTMNSTGQTTIVGEGGTTTTSVQQGLAKVWVQFDGQASGAASRDSLNVGSMTDNGTGNYTVNFSNNMSNDDYASAGIGNTQAITSEAVATTGITLLSANASGSLADVTIMATSIFGDLA